MMQETSDTAIDRQPRYFPQAFGGVDVVKVSTMPGGFRSLVTVKGRLADGTVRVFGFERAHINAELRMVVEGFDARDEVRRAWEIVPPVPKDPVYPSSKGGTHRLPKACSRFGASMGRGGHTPENAAELSARFSLRSVRLDSGGYDSGGAYWGVGARLWQATEEDSGAEMFFRAPTRDRAKACVRERFPKARFYR